MIDNEAVHRELHENPLMYDKDGNSIMILFLR